MSGGDVYRETRSKKVPETVESLFLLWKETPEAVGPEVLFAWNGDRKVYELTNDRRMTLSLRGANWYAEFEAKGHVQLITPGSSPQSALQSFVRKLMTLLGVLDRLPYAPGAVK